MVTKHSRIRQCPHVSGVEFDINKIEARLPMENIEKGTMKIQITTGKSSTTQLQLSSLAEMLNFTCTVVCPRWEFMQRLL